MKIGMILIVAIAFIIPTYLYVDESVARWAIENRGSFIYTLSGQLSEAGKSTFFLIFSALLWAYFKFAKKIQLYAARAGFFFLSVALTGIAANIIKVIFGKARPRVLESDGFFGFTWFNLDSSFQSFPSGHTTTAFAIFTALTLMFPKYWWIFLSYAIMMALARIGYYAHYVSDTIAGAAVGITVTILIYNKYCTKTGSLTCKSN